MFLTVEVPLDLLVLLPAALFLLLLLLNMLRFHELRQELPRLELEYRITHEQFDLVHEVALWSSL